MNFTIVGIDVTPNLKSFQVDFVDIYGDNINTNEQGVIMRDRLKQMRKIQCEWGPMTSSEMSAILLAVSPTGVAVQYTDPISGSDQVRNFYAGDRNTPKFDFVSNMWLGLKMDLIEI
ncbi:MAG: hypothetical protein PHX70_04555 [Clostridium sp.]|nr:hypothetical protein [Clostridium sp.]